MNAFKAAQGSSPATKPINSLILDTGPLIRNQFAPSTLLAHAEQLYTIPAVVSEIRDEATRSRFHTTIAPFVKLRSPRPQSVKVIQEFARWTGDLEVLSRPDIHLLALTYELELERNGGDWRLRRKPGQKLTNSKSDGRKRDDQQKADGVDIYGSAAEKHSAGLISQTVADVAAEESFPVTATEWVRSAEAADFDHTESVVEKLGSVNLSAATEAAKDPETLKAVTPAEVMEPDDTKEVDESEEEVPRDDGEGEWITPSNIKRKQARDNKIIGTIKAQRILQSALLTSDMAMRNVALRINLDLLDPTLSQVTRIKTWVLRCYGCFAISKKMDKQFCPKCGQPTLTRVACSTDADNNFCIYLKRNYHHNTRGNVYSIPKPTHGSASGKRDAVKGGGKNGWGRELILAEDQKEYTKQIEENRRFTMRDAMDDNYLPSILTGDRRRVSARPKVGAGRNVNAKKRK